MDKSKLLRTAEEIKTVGNPDVPLLDKRHERFCNEYVIDFNGARAYRDAGFTARTENGSDRACAWRLLTRSNVKARIQYLLNQSKNSAFESTQATIKQRIVDALNSKITDYMRWDDAGNAMLLPADMLPMPELIQEASIEGGKIRIKLMSKDRALEHLAKIEKLLVDSHEISGELMVRQQLEANEAYKRRMANMGKTAPKCSETRVETKKRSVVKGAQAKKRQKRQ
jgi:phage terminase small subunit